MDRGVWQATVHEVAELDMTETTSSGYNLGLWIVKGHFSLEAANVKAPTGEGPSMPWCYMLATGTLENKLRGDVGIVITTTSVTIFQSIPL